MATVLYGFPSLAESRTQDQRKCEQQLVTAADRYISCLLRARSARSAKRSHEILEKKINRCQGIYRPHFEAVVGRFGEDACTRARVDTLADYIEQATLQIHSASSLGNRGGLPRSGQEARPDSKLVESNASLALRIDFPNDEASMEEYKNHLISLSSFLEENPAITQVVLRVQSPDLYGAFDPAELNETLKDFPTEIQLETRPQGSAQPALTGNQEALADPVKYVRGSPFEATP